MSDRALDARRHAVWAVLDAAHTDGRISGVEHARRSREAGLASHTDELDLLVDDLGLPRLELELRTMGLWDDNPRGPAWDGIGHRRASRSRPGRFVGRARPKHRPSRKESALIYLATVAFIAVPFGLGGLFDRVGGKPSGSGTVEVVTVGPGPLHTRQGFERVVESARDEFGDLPVETITILSENAILVHPDPSQPGRNVRHTFTGSWRVTGHDHAVVDGEPFSLAAVDAATAATAIAEAPEVLGIRGGRIADVTVTGDPVAGPTYRVTVADRERSGSVTVGPDGAIRDLSR